MERSELAGRQPKTRFSIWLREHAITSAELARVMGYSLKAVETWRSGDRYPGPGAMQLLCMRLNITMAELKHLLDE